MKHSSLSKFGGTCSILTGISIIVVAVIYLLLPPEQQDACGCPGKFLETLAQNPTGYIVEYWLFGLYSLLAIAAVLAISENVSSAHEGWVRWTSNLAIIGLAVNAIDAFRRVALDPVRAVAYVHGDAAIKATLTVPGALQGLDPQDWLRGGAFGLWVFVVSLLALRGGAWPKPLAYVGIGVAITAWLALIGQVFQIPSVLTIVAGVGALILVPLWYIWLGLRLRKTS